MDRLALVNAVEWVLACVAPETVAPHPNFQTKAPHVPALLGLLAECRFDEFERYRELLVPTGDDDMDVVDAIEMSLSRDSQREGAGLLAEFAHSNSRRVGVRAAAALFAATALAKADDLSAAVDVVNAALSPTIGGNSRNASERLIAAALRQQLVLRFIEQDRLEEAYVEAATVESMSRVSSDSVDTVETSKGYSGGSRSAHRDAFATLRSHAQSVRTTLAPRHDRSWVSLVRSRPSRPDERSYRSIAHAGEALAKRDFEGELSWVRRRYAFLSRDPVVWPVYSALLHAELTGDVGATRRWRDLLGRLRLLDRSTERHWATEEALRLLRQSDAHEALGDALQLIRAEGPTEVVKEAATRLVESGENARLTRSDLTVVASAAEFLDRGMLQRAIRYCEGFHTQPARQTRLSGERPATWAAADFAWTSIVRLLPGSELDDDVAGALFEFLSGLHDHGELVVRSLTQVAETVDWYRVSGITRAKWSSWALTHAEEWARQLALAALDGVHGVSRHIPHCGRPTGLELATRVIWERQNGVIASPREVHSSVAACEADMARTADSASLGHFSIGGLSGAEVATIFAVDFHMTELFDPLLEFIGNHNIPMPYKAPALDRLAHLSSEVPQEVLPLLIQRVRMLADPNQALDFDPFDSNPFPVNPEAVRLLIVTGGISEEHGVKLITDLLSDQRVQAKIEAVRCLAVAVSSYLSEWPGMMLLQLSFDSDAVVRAQAGRALAGALAEDRRFNYLLVERVLELLASPGSLIPLLTVHGLRTNLPLDASLGTALRAMANAHPSRMVRHLADAAVAEHAPDPGP